MNIITKYALEQLHKEGITLDMLTAAINNIGKVRDYSPTGFIATLIAKRDSSNESSEHAKYKILITPTDNSKLALIKLVKDTFSLGLKEAKDVVDAAPTMIDRWYTIDEFDKIHKYIIEQDDRFANNIRLNI